MKLLLISVMFLVGCGKDGVNGNNGMNTSSIRAIPIYKLSGSSELTEAVIEAVFEEDVEDVSLLYKQKQINNMAAFINKTGGQKKKKKHQRNINK